LGALLDVRPWLDQGRPGRDVAEVSLHPTLHVFGLHVAGHRENRVGRPVVGLEPLLDVLERRRVQVLHRTDHRMVVGVAAGIGVLLDHEEGLVVGLVLPLAFLVLNDAALLVELLLRHRTEQVAHAVRLHPQRHVEGRLRHHLEVVRPVLVGGSVHAGSAHAIERLEVVVVVVLAAVEHQVLEQVSEAGLAELHVGRPDVVPDVDRDDRGLVVLVHDQRQAVVQDVPRVGDGDDPLGGLARPARAHAHAQDGDGDAQL
jgi:phage shock protein PspC (stress-responsive transcriptional regulator)